MKRIWTLVLKDIKLFLADPKGMIITLAVPVAIASFMAMIFGGSGDGGDDAVHKLDMLVVDNDNSILSKAVLKNMSSGTMVNPKASDQRTATEQVKKGKVPVALVIPKGFGKQAPQAMFAGDKPKLELLYDPSQKFNVQVVRGAVMQSAIDEVSKVAFSGSADSLATARRQITGSMLSASAKRNYLDLFNNLQKISQNSSQSGLATPGARQPFDFVATPEAAKESDASSWGAVAHIFAGMCIQGVLFFGIDAAMGLLRDRRQGIYKRLRASPVKDGEILMGKAISSGILALCVMSAIFIFGALFFKIRITGSYVGFFAVMLMAAIMTAAFGLFVAALGRTEQQSRGFSTFAVIMMSMLGGAWFPSFLMPDWVQKVSYVVPVKWAVDGFDTFVWRGGGLSEAGLPIAGMAVFTVMFGSIALWRYKTMPETS